MEMEPAEPLPMELMRLASRPRIASPNGRCIKPTQIACDRPAGYCHCSPLLRIRAKSSVQRGRTTNNRILPCDVLGIVDGDGDRYASRKLSLALPRAMTARLGMSRTTCRALPSASKHWRARCLARDPCRCVLYVAHAKPLRFARGNTWAICDS